MGAGQEKGRSRAEKEPVELLHTLEMPPLAWKVPPAKVHREGRGAGLEEGVQCHEESV